MPRNAAKRLNNEETRLPTTNINNNNNKVRRNSKTQVTVTSTVQQQQLQTHEISDITKAATTTTTSRVNNKFDLPRINATLEQEQRLLIKLIQKQQSDKESSHVRKEQGCCNLIEQRAKQQVTEFKINKNNKEESPATAAVSSGNLVVDKPKAPQKQKGRRKNWRKGRYQIKTTKRATKSNLTNSSGSGSNSSNNSSCCCCCNISVEAQTAAVGANKNSQRGRECTICGEHVVKTNIQNSNNNNNNKTTGNLGTNLINKDDADSDDDNDNLANKSSIELTTVVDITIKPTNWQDTDATTSEQQKTIRLLSLRQRKRDDDIKRSSSSGNTKPLSTHLDTELYNRIEVYAETEDAKTNCNNSSVNKRKRFDNFSTITTRGRRAATQKYYTESIENRYLTAAAATAAQTATLATSNLLGSNIQAVATLGAAPTAALSDIVTTSSATAATGTATTSTASTLKRRRIMSLYDRRYQTSSATGSRSSDAEIAGRGTLMTNGYLSTTRGANVLSSSAAISDINELAAEVPPYYLPAASQTGAVLVSNGPTLNHAPSMATLCNIGNTCYLNSVLYTLRFAPQFLHNLHHLEVDLAYMQQHLLRQRAKSASLGRGSTSSAANGTLSENARSWSSKDLLSLDQQAPAADALTDAKSFKKGGPICLTQKTQHQLLTEKLHEVYQCLHRNEVVESTEPHHADTLLQAIQEAYVMFAGNQQQDAHEFLMSVLNSLRETSQMLIKTIAECPEVIVNGFIPNPDELDGFVTERDKNSTSGSQTLLGSATSSLSGSSSHVTKASFFSRKSKRKEEGKNSKNTRLQSPLKDVMSLTGQQQTQQQQQQQTSHSLFYLNTKDLNNGSDGAIAATAAGLSGSDEETKATTLFSPAPTFKNKEALTAKIRELGLDFFREDFEGVTVATTKCLSCETITEQRESMIDISVPVPISGYDAADYAEKPSLFIQNSCVTREYFRGENKYRCEQCTGYTEAIRSVSYEVLPRLLVIQLSRFSGGMEKISSYVPTTFTLPCFCSKCCELSEGNKLHVYKLYSVITHVGATMTVGHYIAYTCSLDWANEYMNCPKERQRAAAAAMSNNSQQQLQLQANGSAHAVANTTTNTTTTGSSAASVIASSGTSLIKKMKFGRSKASSSGDITKHLGKNLNGLSVTTNKSQFAITNGISKLSMNSTGNTTTSSQTATPATCYSLNCCATRLCSVHQMQQQQLNDENYQNGHAPSTGYNSYPSGYGSTGRGSSAKSSYNMAANLSAACGSSSEPIWYMCDDDKIKAMPQREFEDILSPSRKVTITPYLLFYARFDLQPALSSSTDKLSSNCSKAISISSAGSASLVSKI